MANNYLRGDAQNVAQIWTWTFLGLVSGDVITATCNRKELAYTVPAATSNDEAVTALAAALSGSGIAEFDEANYSDDTGDLIATGETAGNTFLITFGVVGSGSVSAVTVTQAPKGENHWDDPDNWSLAAIPVAGDVVILRDCSTDILYGMAQSGFACTIIAEASYTGNIGLPENNGNYVEYRATTLRIDASAITVGGGIGSGIGRFSVDVGATACTVVIYKTGQGDAGTGQQSFQFLGTNAANTLTVIGGSVALARKIGTVATMATIRIGGGDGSLIDFYSGPGVTLTTVSVGSGDCEFNSAITTLTQTSGNVLFRGTGGITTLNGDGGNHRYQSSGTLGSLVGGTGFLIDLTGDIRGRTFTNMTLYAGSGFRDTFKTVTFTNPFLLKCKLNELSELDLGENIGLQRS